MSKFGAMLREVLMPLAMLAMLGYLIHEKLNPPPPAPDRVEKAAAAYLAMQPTSLGSVARGIRAGSIKTEGVSDAIAAAHLPAATELAAALKSAPDLADALDRAALVIERGIR